MHASQRAEARMESDSVLRSGLTSPNRLGRRPTYTNTHTQTPDEALTRQA